ncbi:hypothetical protein IAU60_006904 [Kwoniella sp. DSM 27419]
MLFESYRFVLDVSICSDGVSIRRAIESEGGRVIPPAKYTSFPAANTLILVPTGPMASSSHRASQPGLIEMQNPPDGYLAQFALSSEQVAEQCRSIQWIFKCKVAREILSQDSELEVDLRTLNSMSARDLSRWLYVSRYYRIHKHDFQNLTAFYKVMDQQTEYGPLAAPRKDSRTATFVTKYREAFESRDRFFQAKQGRSGKASKLPTIQAMDNGTVNGSFRHIESPAPPADKPPFVSPPPIYAPSPAPDDPGEDTWVSATAGPTSSGEGRLAHSSSVAFANTTPVVPPYPLCANSPSRVSADVIVLDILPQYEAVYECHDTSHVLLDQEVFKNYYRKDNDSDRISNSAS